MKRNLLLSLLLFVFAGASTSKQNPCLELRLYRLMPNKTEAVLARFRNHVDPLFRKHGLTPLGYWIAKDSINGDSFIYMLSAPTIEDNKKSMAAFSADPQFQAAYKLSEEVNGKTVQKIESWFINPINGSHEWSLDQSKSHIYEFQMYTAQLDMREKFIKRWQKSAVPLYKKHGLSTVGGWTTKQNADDMIFWMLAGGSSNEMAASKQAVFNDPAWKEMKKKMDGTVTQDVKLFNLIPTDFSPLK